MVDKDRVFPPIPLDELRRRGIPPAVAYLFTAIHRAFPRRPPPSSRGRSVYVSYVPWVLRKALDAKSIEELQAFLISVGFHFPRNDLENREALGARFWNLISFARISSSFIWERACEIQGESDAERAWELARRRPHRDRDGEGGDPDGGMDGAGRGAKPLPARRKRPLDEIRRVGPPVTAAGPEDLIDRFGFTGIEFGNWVAQEEGRRHVLLIAGAFQDLQEIVGLDLRRLARSGNLALALGSRGKGSACAHYEPLKRVINLTRTACDGSVAHEFAHFLDHLAGLQFGATLSGESILSGAPSFLSEGKHRGHEPSAPAKAMVRLLEVIESGEVEEDVESKATDRWYDPKWIHRWLEEAGGEPQAGLDRICFMFTPIFREGRKARDRSVCLVDSMARLLQIPLRLRIRYRITTGFAEQARALGGYWRRRHELFARAFESHIEDELHSRSRCNEYLVDDTRRDYEGCRGSPYPRGDERARIQEALRGFLETLKDRWGQASS